MKSAFLEKQGPNVPDHLFREMEALAPPSHSLQQRPRLWSSSREKGRGSLSILRAGRAGTKAKPLLCACHSEVASNGPFSGGGSPALPLPSLNAFCAAPRITCSL